MRDQVPLTLPPVRTPVLFIPGQKPGFGYELDRILSPPPGGTGGAPAGPYPFDVEFSGGPDPKDANVRPGTINGVLPSNFEDIYSLSAASVYYLVLTVTANDGEIVSCSLSMPTSPPAGIPTEQGQPPTAFDYLLGVVVNLTWYRVIGPGSLAATGGEVFRVSKVSPAPGTLPYDIWYNWFIGSVI